LERQQEAHFRELPKSIRLEPNYSRRLSLLVLKVCSNTGVPENELGGTYKKNFTTADIQVWPGRKKITRGIFFLNGPLRVV
jgi:hypothetical protein